MILALSFLTVSALFWAVFAALIPTPFLLTRPASLDTVEAYKRVELYVFLITAFGVPLLSLVIARVAQRYFAKPEARREKTKPDTRHPHHRSFGWFWTWLIPIVLFIFVPRPPQNTPIAHMDEGLRVAAANQSLHGKKLYREIYLLYGPGIDTWQPRLAFRWFGKTLAAQRALEWIVEPFGAIALYWLALSVLGSGWGVTFLLLIIGGRNPPFWVTPRMALPLLALSAFLKALRGKTLEKQRHWAFLSGIVTCAAFLYSKEAGFFPPAIVLVTLGLLALRAAKHDERTRPYIDMALVFVIGGTLLLLPLLVYWTFQGSFTDFFTNSFLVSSSVLSAWGKPTPPLASTLTAFVQNPLSLFAYTAAPARWWFPVLLYMISLTSALRRTLSRHAASEDPALLLLSLTGLFFFLVAMGRSDYDHWLKGTPVYWLLLVVWIERFVFTLKKDQRNGKWDVGRRAFQVLGILFLGKVAWGFGTWNDLVYKFKNRSPWPAPAARANDPTLERLGNLSLSPTEEAQLRGIVERLQRFAGGKPIWIFGDEATYYFLTDLLNPTRYANVTFLFTDQMMQELIRDLENAKPACILAIPKHQGLEHLPQHKPLADWVIAHYKVAEEAEGHLFLIPK